MKSCAKLISVTFSGITFDASSGGVGDVNQTFLLHLQGRESQGQCFYELNTSVFNVVVVLENDRNLVSYNIQNAGGVFSGESLPSSFVVQNNSYPDHGGIATINI